MCHPALLFKWKYRKSLYKKKNSVTAVCQQPAVCGKKGRYELLEWNHIIMSTLSFPLTLDLPSFKNNPTTNPMLSFNRKISAHEFERGGLLKPLVTTVDGTPTFLGDQPPHATPSRPQRRSRHELRQLDEKELIFELVSIYYFI